MASDTADDIDAYIRTVKELCSRCGSTRKIQSISDCEPTLFVELYESILGERLPDAIRNPSTRRDHAHNAQAVVDSLALDVLRVDLSHIHGDAVADGDAKTVCNLIEIFAGLVEYIMEQLEQRGSAEVSPGSDRESTYVSLPETLSRTDPFSFTETPLPSNGNALPNNGTASPRISRSLNSVVAQSGGVVRFVAMVAGRPSPEVSWLHDGRPVAPNNRCFLQSGNEHVLTITDIVASDEGKYTMVASNAVGRAVTTAELHVEAPNSPGSPVIVTPLGSQSVTPGDKLQLEVCVQSRGSLPTVMWTKDGNPIHSGGRIRVFHEGYRNVLVVPRCERGDAGRYAVTVENGSGRCVSVCEVRVGGGEKVGGVEKVGEVEKVGGVEMVGFGEKVGGVETVGVRSHAIIDNVTDVDHSLLAPFFVEPLYSMATSSRQPVTMTAVIKGLPTPTVHWEHNGTRVTPSRLYSLVTWGNRYSLVINQPGRGNGRVCVVARNAHGQAVSTAALNVGPPGRPSYEEFRQPTRVTDDYRQPTRVTDDYRQPTHESEDLIDHIPVTKETRVQLNAANIDDLITESRLRDRLADSYVAATDSDDASYNDQLKDQLLDKLRVYREKYESQREAETPGAWAEPRANPLDIDGILDRQGRGPMKDIRRLVDREDRLAHLDDDDLAVALQETLSKMKIAEDDKLDRLRKAVDKIQFRYDALKRLNKSESKPAGKYQSTGRRTPSGVYTRGQGGTGRGQSGTGLGQTTRRKSGKSKSVRKPDVLEEHEVLPYLYDEFPWIQLAPETARLMWQKQLRALDVITRPPTSSRRSLLQRRIEEAEKRQSLMMAILRRDIEHTNRVREKKEKVEHARNIRAKVREQKQTSARIRRYYDDFEVTQRSRMLKRRTREEVLFKGLFEEGLEIQKERVRELRKYAREKRDERAVKHHNEIESLENYYKDQFNLLAEAMAKERKDLLVRERAQSKVVNKMKVSLRNKLEKDINELQEYLLKDEKGIYFRELQADRCRHQLQNALYRTDV